MNMNYCYCLSASLKCTFTQCIEKGSCVPHLFSIEIRCCFLKHEFMKKKEQDEEEEMKEMKKDEKKTK